MGAEMSELEPPPLALPVECYQIRTGTPAASDVTDRGVGVVRDDVLRATKGDVDPGCVATGPGSHCSVMSVSVPFGHRRVTFGRWQVTEQAVCCRWQQFVRRLALTRREQDRPD